MKSIDVANSFENLDRNNQLVVLLKISHELTFHLRIALSEELDTSYMKICNSLNEINNKIVGQSLAILSNADRYPAKVFFEIVSDLSKNGDISNLMDDIFSKFLLKKN